MGVIEEKINAIEDYLIRLRRGIHACPEPGFKELQTAKTIVNWLKTCDDVEIATDVAGTGVVALVRGAHPGATIGLRVDIDALELQDEKQVPYASQNPGICHACGHDVHTAIGLGVVKVLSQLKAKLCGNVKVIFQPSEESPLMEKQAQDIDSFSEFATGKAAAQMVIEEGVLENPKVDRMLGIHCWPSLPVGTIGYQYGVAMASAANFHIAIHGKGAHAAKPNEALDPLPTVAQLILALQTLASRRVDPNEPFVLTVATVKGGSKRYTISSRVDLTGTVRASNEDAINHEIRRHMETMIKGICEGNENEYTFEYSDAFAPVINDADVVTDAIAALQGLDGIHTTELKDVALTVDDFACYSQLVPSFYIKLGTAGQDESTRYPLHSSLFNVDERCIKIGVLGLVKIVLDYLGIDVNENIAVHDKTLG